MRYIRGKERIRSALVIDLKVSFALEPGARLHKPGGKSPPNLASIVRRQRGTKRTRWALREWSRLA